MTEAIEEFRKKYKDKPEIDHVCDFLEAVYPWKNRFNFSYEQAVEKANEWTKKLNLKNVGLKEAGEVEFITNLDDGFKLVRLLNQTAKDWEGLHMGHCVSHYKKHEGIYSIRDKHNYPKVTFEISGGVLYQLQGHSNKPVTKKYHHLTAKALKYFFKEKIIREDTNGRNEMYKIQYQYLYRKDLKKAINSFENIISIEVKNSDYAYMGNKLNLKENPEFSSSLFYMVYISKQCPEYLRQALESDMDMGQEDHQDIVLRMIYSRDKKGLNNK